MTGNGTTHKTEEATEQVCDLDMFVQAQFLKESPAVLSLGKLCEEIGYPHEWHPGQPPDLIENGRTSRVTPTRNTRRRLWRTGSRHCCGRQRARRVGTELPERRQPVMEGLTRESSSSTVVSPVDVAFSPTIPPSAHPPAKPTSKPTLRSMRTHESYENAMQKKS